MSSFFINNDIECYRRAVYAAFQIGFGDTSGVWKTLYDGTPRGGAAFLRLGMHVELFEAYDGQAKPPEDVRARLIAERDRRNEEIGK